MAENLNDGGAAFPMCFGPNDLRDAKGMSLRDYFAGQALVGLLGNVNCSLREDYASWYAETSYKIADAMIAAKGTRKD